MYVYVIYMCTDVIPLLRRGILHVHKNMGTPVYAPEIIFLYIEYYRVRVHLFKKQGTGKSSYTYYRKNVMQCICISGVPFLGKHYLLHTIKTTKEQLTL